VLDFRQCLSSRFCSFSIYGLSNIYVCILFVVNKPKTVTARAVVPGDPTADPVAHVVPTSWFMSSLAFLLASACFFFFSDASRFQFLLGFVLMSWLSFFGCPSSITVTVGLFSFRHVVQVIREWYTSSFFSFSSGFRALSSARSTSSRTQMLSGTDIATG
jgi:hypothetical protein